MSWSKICPILFTGLKYVTFIYWSKRCRSKRCQSKRCRGTIENSFICLHSKRISLSRCTLLNKFNLVSQPVSGTGIGDGGGGDGWTEIERKDTHWRVTQKRKVPLFVIVSFVSFQSCFGRAQLGMTIGTECFSSKSDFVAKCCYANFCENFSLPHNNKYLKTKENKVTFNTL